MVMNMIKKEKFMMNRKMGVVRMSAIYYKTYIFFFLLKEKDYNGK